jgi:hypothetical protein
MSKEYNLHLTGEQADTIVKALNLFMRVGMGEFTEILEHPTIRTARLSTPGSLPEPHNWRESLFRIQREVFPKLRSGNYGITSPEIGDENRIAYDLFQVIQHRRSWDEPFGQAAVAIENGHTPTGVNFQEPMQVGPQPLARIEKELEYTGTERLTDFIIDTN